MNNEMMQQQMDGMQPPEGDTEQNPLANDEDTDATPETDEKVRKLQKAKADYNLLSKKKNRSLSDEAKYKSAALILAKNK